MMMQLSTVDQFLKEPENRRLFEQERLFVDVTELLCNVMETSGVKRAELAERLGRSKAFVTQILRGNQNLTLRTLSDVFFALNHRLLVVAEPMLANTGTVSVRPWSQTQQAGNLILENQDEPTEDFIGEIAA